MFFHGRKLPHGKAEPHQSFEIPGQLTSQLMPDMLHFLFVNSVKRRTQQEHEQKLSQHQRQNQACVQPQSGNGPLPPGRIRSGGLCEQVQQNGKQQTSADGDDQKKDQLTSGRFPERRGQAFLVHGQQNMSDNDVLAVPDVVRQPDMAVIREFTHRTVQHPALFGNGKRSARRVPGGKNIS